MVKGRKLKQKTPNNLNLCTEQPRLGIARLKSVPSLQAGTLGGILTDLGLFLRKSTIVILSAATIALLKICPSPPVYFDKIIALSDGPWWF